MKLVSSVFSEEVLKCIYWISNNNTNKIKKCLRVLGYLRISYAVEFVPYLVLMAVASCLIFNIVDLKVSFVYF